MFTKFEPRPIRALPSWEWKQWRLKGYHILGPGERADPVLVARAKRIAERILPFPATSSVRHGTGFVTLHQAPAFHQVLVNWWEHSNELRHHVFKALPEAPTDFEEITVSGEAFCVWELEVLAYERNVWIDTMLCSGDSPCIDTYLSRVLNRP